jgi:hypothetical protein
MSISVMSQCWSQSKHSATDLLMLLAIADFSDDKGKAYPAIGTLAAKCRMGRRNAQYVIKKLEDSGELSVLVKKGPPPKFPNLYRINLKALQVQHLAQVQASAQVQSSVATGASGCAFEVQPVAHKPSVTIKNHQKTFSEFWDAYPNGKRKGSKAQCLTVWQKQNFDSVAEQIIAHVTAMASSDDWSKDSGKYIPAPLVYLRQQRWDGAEVVAQATADEMYF